MTPRTWAPVASWWVPVWVVLDGAGSALDPLEDAVLALIGAHTVQSDGIASMLSVPIALVESALADLQSRGLVTLRDGAWQPVPTTNAAVVEPAERAAFVAWDDAL